ncbi:hypothetical protein CY35_12G002700 [Sphagnum magellanicum]|nr:hypothetical protein CY35_12G002700 [Sphagnum magellanicum]
MKRAFSIGWTLAQDAASRQLQLSKFKGVRFRRKHNHSKPWIARSKITTGKIRDWINCSTEVVAALASDVGTIYFGKGKEALNFEETPRLLEKVSEDLKEEDQKVQEVRDQVRLLTKNPLVCLIYDLSEELFDLDISLNFKTQGDELYFLLIKLIRLVRRENEAAVSASQPADIPQLLESINQILKRNVAPTGVSGHWYHRLISRFLSRLPPMKAFAKHCSLVPHFIRWVETEVVISRQLSRSSLSPTETEDPPVDISSGCNTPIGHFPHLHEQTQDTLEHGSRDSLSREHGTFQAATPNNQGAIMGIRPSKNNCVDQATTTLSSLAPTDGEIMLFPSHHSDVEVANHISQIGTPEHLEILQNDCIWVEDSRDSMLVSSEKMQWTIGREGLDTQQRIEGSNFQMTPMLVTSIQSQHDFPFTYESSPQDGDAPIQMATTTSPLSNAVHVNENLLQQFMDSDDGEDLTSLLVTAGPDHHESILELLTQSEQTLRHNLGGCNLDIDRTELASITSQLQVQMATTSRNAVHVKENPLQRFMDSDDGEDLTSLLVTPGPDQHESVLELLTQHEQTLRCHLYGHNLDMGTKSTSITSHPDGNQIDLLDMHLSLAEPNELASITSHTEGSQIDSLDMHLSLAEPSEMASISSHMEGNQIDPLDMHLSLAKPTCHPTFSQQSFVQFDEYLFQ